MFKRPFNRPLARPLARPLMRPLINVGGVGIEGLVPSAQFELMASDLRSYDGTAQTFVNVLGNSAFNMTRGLNTTPSTDDPAFVGSAGVPGAYFQTDGGDFLRVTGGTNPSLFADLHKTNSANNWWMAVAFRTQAAFGTSGVLWGTQNNASSEGLAFVINSTGQLRTQHHNGSVQLQQILLSTGVVSTNYLAIISYDGTANAMRHWINTRTRSTVSSVFTTGAVNNATAGFRAFTNGGGSTSAVSGVRIYGLMGGNALIDTPDAGNIIDYFNASTGLTFA